MKNLRNNFIMASVKLGYSDGKGNVTNKHLDFYNRRSKHVGAVTLEPLYMDSGLRELPTQLGIDSDEKILELKKITKLIHSNGAKVIAHINHPGRMANPMIPGNYWWSSTDKACPNGGKTPEKMDREMMDTVKQMIVDAAIRAEKASFDYIELQYGHGYLFSQFLSSAVNDRTDEYGGSFDNRAKFPLEVFDEVKKSINVPVIIRLSAEDFTPNGIHIDEAIKLAKRLEEKGASAIHVVSASACYTPPWFFQHMFVPKGKTWELASKIKENISIPVIFVGKINSAKDIETIKQKYNGEYFALGRAMVADPDFVGKYLRVIKKQIRPCMACSEGCLGGVKAGKGLGCVVNPQVNTGLPDIDKINNPKKYAVIGGGLAGMQAAVLLKEKGHDIDLYEKNKLGGQFNLAYLPPKKESLKEIIDYLINELNHNNVNIINHEVTKEDVISKKYDGVIMATGSEPFVPKIEGLTKYYWTEFLDDRLLPLNKNILVVGGGLIGLEVASKLVENNNMVTIVEMLDDIARGMEMIEKVMTVKKLKEKNTKILTNHKLTKVIDDKIFLESNGRTIELNNIDSIVIATGMKSYLPFDLQNEKVYKIGDAKKVGKAQEAIYDAYKLALEL